MSNSTSLIKTITNNQLVRTAATVVLTEVSERGTSGVYDYVMDSLATKIADRLIEAEERQEEKTKKKQGESNVVRLRRSGKSS